MKISIIIPALNEEAGIGNAISQIPVNSLKRMGHSVEILVVDNGSTDDTAQIARKNGARVVSQPVRGYGNAYKAGFENATGDLIVTGDADMTYPFETIPELVRRAVEENIDFMNTDRLSQLNPAAMTFSHVVGNRILTLIARILFGWPFKDSQSGMWIFKRAILDRLDLDSTGMPFSQDLKIEAYIKGFKCAEAPIEYRVRAGEVKLNTIRDGWRNISHMFKKRFALKRSAAKISAEELS